MGIGWLPLESNPEVMNKYLETLGVSSNWAVCDVYGLDDELLALLPSPVLGFLLLFPLGTSQAEYFEKKEKEMAENKFQIPEKLFYMKQTIKNACGTIALLHALANNKEKIGLSESSPLFKFLQESDKLSPEERGKLLETFEDIGSAHDDIAQQGQTEASDEDVDLHFIALVCVDNKLYELDGRKSGPFFHGTTSESSFVKDAAKICKEYMERDPGNMRYNLMALAASG